MNNRRRHVLAVKFDIVWQEDLLQWRLHFSWFGWVEVVAILKENLSDGLVAERLLRLWVQCSCRAPDKYEC